MPDIPRPRWSHMRIWTLATALALTLTLAIVGGAGIYYTGVVQPGTLTWILMCASVICWMAHIAAHVRDSSIAHQRLILARIDQLAETVADYGDRREIAGHAAAAGSLNGRGRLSPVD